MKNRYQLTPSRDIYDGCIYSIEGERVTSFSHYTWSMPCIIPFPNDEKCPVSQAGNKAYGFLNMSWKLPSATPKSHLWQVLWAKDNIKNVKLPNFSPTFFKKEGILLFHHLTILPFDCLFVKRTKATGRWARLGNTDNRQRKICVIIYSFMAIFHQKPAFMVKIPHFRVYWRLSFVCVGVFTRE